MEQYIIPALATIVITVIEAIAAKERRHTTRNNEKVQRQAAVRSEESRLSMQMMSATLQLSVVTANALTGGHNNGNVESAKAAAEHAMLEYSCFINKIASKEVVKF